MDIMQALTPGDLTEPCVQAALQIIGNRFSTMKNSELTLVACEDKAYEAGRLVERFGLKEGLILPDELFANNDGWALVHESWLAFYSLGALVADKGIG